MPSIYSILNNKIVLCVCVCVQYSKCCISISLIIHSSQQMSQGHHFPSSSPSQLSTASPSPSLRLIAACSKRKGEVFNPRQIYMGVCACMWVGKGEKRSVYVPIRIYLEYSVSTEDGWQCRLQSHTADQHYNSILCACVSVRVCVRVRRKEGESERL